MISGFVVPERNLARAALDCAGRCAAAAGRQRHSLLIVTVWAVDGSRASTVGRAGLDDAVLVAAVDPRVARIRCVPLTRRILGFGRGTKTARDTL